MPVQTNFNRAPFRRRVLENQKQLRRADARTSQAVENRPKGIGQGAKGAFVVNIKKHLNAAGYKVATLDESFGAATTAAVKAFQKHSGLPVTGVVDGATWKKLDPKLFAAKNATSPWQRAGERGAVIKKSEQLLKKLGMKPGKVDGFFSDRTEAAVKKFQNKHDLQATGAINARTLKAMKKAVGPDLGPFVTMTAYRIGNPFKIQVAKVDGVMMSKPTALAFLKVKAAAAKDGVHLKVVSGFRTMAQQQALWDKFGPPRAARPGFSNHQSGIALDIETGNGTNAASSWLLKHGNRFGFKKTVSFEPWHWEYLP